jgi:hypothetical protein
MIQARLDGRDSRLLPAQLSTADAMLDHFADQAIAEEQPPAL